MPELPEVETVRRSLLTPLIGERVTRVTIHRPDIITACAPDGSDQQGVTGRSPRAALLEGAVITELRRRGKQLAILAAPVDRPDVPRAMVVHLGMTGQLMMTSESGQPHTHVTWRLASGVTLVFRDPRRFGGLWTLPTLQALDQRWDRLGPDALSIDPSVLEVKLRDAKRPIKAALLDQDVLAGVGNIYADESLFLARIHPLTHARRLKPDQVERLASAIRHVLSRAIEAGGSSLRDGMYVSGDGSPGSFQQSHSVYARAGQPCLRCQTTLKTGIVAQRTTVWCSTCQGRPSR